MLTLCLDNRVEYVDIIGSSGVSRRLFREDWPFKSGQIWPLVVDGRQIGTMVGQPRDRVGFAGVDRTWRIVRSNAHSLVRKGAAP